MISRETRRRWFVIAMAAVAVVVLCVTVLRGRQLTYNGRSFERHIELAGSQSIEKAALELGPERTIPLLIEALGRNDGLIKKVRIKLWSKLPASFRQKRVHWTPMPSVSTQYKVATVLMQIGIEASNAVPVLVRLVKTTPYPSSATFIVALGETGRDSRQAREALIMLSSSMNQQLSSLALLELARFPNGVTQIVSMVVSNLESGTASPPHNELLALRMLGTNAASAAPGVLRWLDNPQAKGNAAAALTRLGPGAAVAVPVIGAHADEPWAIEALINIGPAASNALPALTNVMRRSYGVTRLLAIAAIGRITGDQGWSGHTIAFHLNRRETFSVGPHTWSPPWNDMRNISIGLGQEELACWLLGELGPFGRAGVPALTNLLAKTNGWTPIFAARALWMIESNSTLTVPPLVTALNSPRSDIPPQLAARVLGEIGPAAKVAAPDLQRARSRSWKVRREATEALRKIESR
jgi:hypothetical protein